MNINLEIDTPIKTLINLALEEDEIKNDISVECLKNIPQRKTQTQATIITKQECISCGSDLPKAIIEEAYQCKKIFNQIKVQKLFPDGQKLKPNTPWLIFEGDPLDILKLERVILNFLMRLTGIATTTHHLVEKIKHTNTKLLHTRKTMPGFRSLDIYACLIGGAHAHRKNLKEAILIKENHIRTAKDLTKIFKAIDELRSQAKFVEIEVTNFNELKYAILAKPDRIMLDNFSVENCRKAVELFGASVSLEASGGINENNILDYANTNVDYVSLGYITHSPKACDLSMLFSYD
jgi:nicotinate-nucleotide pyrophosphorylase (carboxylating)